MIAPIPLYLLIHTVIYEEYQDNSDGYGEGYKDPVTLRNVRVEPVSSLRRSNTTETQTFNSILFFDMTHSTPQVNFVEKSKVTFNGQEMVVSKVNPMYSLKLHHYEIELT